MNNYKIVITILAISLLIGVAVVTQKDKISDESKENNNSLFSNSSFFIANPPVLSFPVLTFTSPTQQFLEIRVPSNELNKSEGWLNAVLNKNATMQVYDVGDNFQWREITIDFNKTVLQINNSKYTNLTQATWYRENNTMIIEN